MAKSGNGNGGNGNGGNGNGGNGNSGNGNGGNGNGGNGNSGNGNGGNGNGGNGGLNPGFSVSFDSESGTYTPSGPTTPSWAPGNTPGSGDTNPAGLNNSENNNNDDKSYALSFVNKGADTIGKLFSGIFLNPETERSYLPTEAVEAGDKAYTESRARGLSEEESQFNAREAVRGKVYGKNNPLSYKDIGINAFEGKSTRPTYDPSVPARVNTNKNIAKGSSEMGPSAPAVNNTPAPAPAVNNTPADTSAPAANNAPGGNLGGETGGIVSGATPTNTSDAVNTGVTYRGGTVTTPSGTSVTDSGTGGSISSSIATPTRDESSIGLGVYNNDRANYDQDNWNRGMEAESSSLVSDEECKAFAKRAFMENSEPFKKVRITIIKNVR